MGDSLAEAIYKSGFLEAYFRVHILLLNERTGPEGVQEEIPGFDEDMLEEFLRLPEDDEKIALRDFFEKHWEHAAKSSGTDFSGEIPSCERNATGRISLLSD